MQQVVDNYLDDVFETLRGYKALAEKAMQQVTDEEFFHQIDEESNSIAVILKHISGNQISRFTDFLTTDGEKPERDRDSEFIIDETARNVFMNRWEEGWGTLFRTLEKLNSEDCGKSVRIRGEPHTVTEAINRQLTHYAYHIGQIVFLAKHFRSSDWNTVSVPRNSSAEFNEFLAQKRVDGESRKSPLEGPAEFVSRKK